jgi:hypothetical protein
MVFAQEPQQTMLTIMKNSAAAYASGWYMSSPERLLPRNSLQNYSSQHANRKRSFSARFDGKHTRDSALQKLFFYWTKESAKRVFYFSFRKSRSLHPGEAHAAHRTRFAARRAKMRRERKSRVPHGGIGMTMLIEAQEESGPFARDDQHWLLFSMLVRLSSQ